MYAILSHTFGPFSGKLSFTHSPFSTRGLVAIAGFQLTFLGTILLGTTFLIPYSATSAQDWPQMMGPERSGQAIGHPPLDTHWAQHLPLSWKVEIGSGYAGPVVVGEQVLVMHRIDKEEVLEALALSDGQSLWRASWPASYRSSMDPDSGPRCVPTVKGHVAICYGAAGDMVAVDIRNGKLLWQRALRNEYNADDGYFGAGSAPLVVGDLIVVCLGGQDAGIVGLDLTSGKTRWTATNYDASYTAPIAIDPQTAMVVTRLKTVLLDLTDGRILSEITFGSRGPTVNAATPIPLGDGRFFLTASYGVGSTLLSIKNRQIETLWNGSELLSSQYNTPVLAAGKVLGINGREDVGVASLRAIDVDKQEVLWEQPNFGTAHLIAIGEQVLAISKAGQMTLVDARANGYRQLAASAFPTGVYRAPPALSAGNLVVRDSRAPGKSGIVLCFELPMVDAGGDR